MRDKSWIHDGELCRGVSIVSLGQCESNGMMMITFAKSAKSTTFYPPIQTIELISTSIDSTSTLPTGAPLEHDKLQHTAWLSTKIIHVPGGIRIGY
jgi:hypothetical protein